MCARYGIVDPFRLSNRFSLPSELPGLTPRYNSAPTQPMPVVIEGGGENRLETMRWGLVPAWAKDTRAGSNLINARSETVSEKPSFRGPFRSRRCLILASHFFEWA